MHRTLALLRHYKRPAPELAALAFFGACLLAALPAQAQYKIVNPDGSVTYTDKPPTQSNAKVTSMNRRGTSLPPDAPAGNNGLPLELRQAAARYPVTLYASGDCTPCDNGRKFLVQRGIPFAEKRIATEEDATALDRAVGGRTVPALTIGAQPLRGYSETDWGAYLDAAGYPRESKLPRNWTQQPAQPMVETKSPTRTAAQAPAEAPPQLPEPTSGGPRF